MDVRKFFFTGVIIVCAVLVLFTIPETSTLYGENKKYEVPTELVIADEQYELEPEAKIVEQEVAEIEKDDREEILYLPIRSVLSLMNMEVFWNGDGDNITAVILSPPMAGALYL